MPELFGTLDGTKPHDRLAILQDGRLIAMGKSYLKVDSFFPSAACHVLNVRVPDLRMIEYVLNVQLTVDALDCTKPPYEVVNKKITGNVVGMTLTGLENTAGGTIHVEVIAIGPP